MLKNIFSRVLSGQEYCKSVISINSGRSNTERDSSRDNTIRNILIY